MEPIGKLFFECSEVYAQVIILGSISESRELKFKKLAHILPSTLATLKPIKIDRTPSYTNMFCTAFGNFWGLQQAPVNIDSRKRIRRLTSGASQQMRHECQLFYPSIQTRPAGHTHSPVNWLRNRTSCSHVMVWNLFPHPPCAGTQIIS